MSDVLKVNQNITSTQTSSLKDQVQQNWNNRKVQVIGTGTSALALGGGVATTTLLGGPLVAIITLAAAAFVALGLTVASLFVPSKAQPAAQQKEMMPAPQIQPIQPKSLPVQGPTPRVQQPVIEPAVIQPEQTKTTPSVEKQKSLFDRTVSYVKEHPYKSAAIGAAAVATGVGLYTLLGGAASTVAPAPLMIAPPTAKLMIAPPPHGTCPVPAGLIDSISHADRIAQGICQAPLKAPKINITSGNHRNPFPPPQQQRNPTCGTSTFDRLSETLIRQPIACLNDLPSNVSKAYHHVIKQAGDQLGQFLTSSISRTL